jgi:hypothetical protein
MHCVQRSLGSYSQLQWSRINRYPLALLRMQTLTPIHLYQPSSQSRKHFKDRSPSRATPRSRGEKCVHETSDQIRFYLFGLVHAATAITGKHCCNIVTLVVVSLQLHSFIRYSKRGQLACGRLSCNRVLPVGTQQRSDRPTH